MKILYGVQGTGNGHISRSRETVRELRTLGHDVNVLLSGRKEEEFWDIEEFAPYSIRRGLTFITQRGEVKYLKTAMQLNLIRFYRDIAEFETADIDLVITDYDPVSARIAKRHKIPIIGIGHQYAFCFPIPQASGDPLARWVFRNYAPVDFPIGLHWHHFGQPILPPIVPQSINGENISIPDKILVYLPFEEVSEVKQMLRRLSSHHFYYYTAIEQAVDEGNIHLRPFSRRGFLNDLLSSSGIISNCGFELTSEALHCGKKILALPLRGQMEQQSNAVALEKLGMGTVMWKSSADAIRRWLEKEANAPQNYPNVAKLCAEWIDRGNFSESKDLVEACWP